MENTKELTRDITKYITYMLSVFAPIDAGGECVFLMKNGIMPVNLHYADIGGGENMQKLKSRGFVTPTDVLTAQLTDRINEYYSGIQLTRETEELLQRYGERGEVFKNQFEMYVET